MITALSFNILPEFISYLRTLPPMLPIFKTKNWGGIQYRTAHGGTEATFTLELQVGLGRMERDAEGPYVSIMPVHVEDTLREYGLSGDWRKAIAESELSKVSNRSVAHHVVNGAGGLLVNTVETSTKVVVPLKGTTNEIPRATNFRLVVAVAGTPKAPTIRPPVFGGPPGFQQMVPVAPQAAVMQYAYDPVHPYAGLTFRLHFDWAPAHTEEEVDAAITTTVPYQIVSGTIYLNNNRD